MGGGKRDGCGLVYTSWSDRMNNSANNSVAPCGFFKSIAFWSRRTKRGISRLNLDGSNDSWPWFQKTQKRISKFKIKFWIPREIQEISQPCCGKGDKAKLSMNFLVALRRFEVFCQNLQLLSHDIYGSEQTAARPTQYAAFLSFTADFELISSI